MESINYSPRMAQYLVRQGLFAEDPFTLVDVGASGGIASHWEVFGDCFQAFAFEPLVYECEKLNREKGEKTSYHPYFVQSDDQEVRSASGNSGASEVFQRTSAAYVYEFKKYDYAKEHFNSGQERVYTKDRISLDRFFAERPGSIDFIKIDTDGYDFEVLHGAQGLLKGRQVLGVEIESQFHGRLHPYSNTFRNIDLFLADSGFSLFDLDVWRYTRKELPGRFKYDIPAVTLSGQALYADALYFVDAAAKKELSLNPVKILKLACLMEIYCKPDCGAELLIAYKDFLPVDVKRCLDLLVQDMGSNESYRNYLKHFKEKTEDFYPRNYKLFSALFPRRTKLRTIVGKLIRKLQGQNA